MSQFIASSDEERRALRERRRAGDYSVTNRMYADAHAIDPFYDPYDIPLDELDVTHPTLYQHGTHWNYFKRLREEDPVHFHEDSMHGPFWSVTKYKDMMEVDSSHDIFSSAYGINVRTNPPSRQPPPPRLPGGQTEKGLKMFIASDPPKHDEQRKVFTPLFTPRSLAELEPLIRERAADILDNLPRGEEFDWVPAVSIELTARMLATLFGVPQEDRHQLIEWSEAIGNLSDPDVFTSPEEGWVKLYQCRDYFQSYYEERKKLPPQFDLISMMAHDPSTNDMDPDEFLGNILLLIVGGNDTTRNSISGGVLALNQNPEQYAKLKANHDLVPKMVPEIIRWQTPVIHMARTAMEDTEIDGKKIQAGDRVAMWYISGNRDESMIERADEFIIDRANPRQHTAFGYGIHRCVGNRLGEMQLRVLWEEILKRFDHVEVTGEAKYAANNFVHGIRSLPVALPA